MSYAEMILKEVLRSYSIVKGHRTTRCEKEIEKLLTLLNAQYSSTSEECINDRLESLERHAIKLSDIADYSISVKYGILRLKTTKTSPGIPQNSGPSIFGHTVFTVLHNRHASGEVANPNQA